MLYLLRKTIEELMFFLRKLAPRFARHVRHLIVAADTLSVPAVEIFNANGAFLGPGDVKLDRMPAATIARAYSNLRRVSFETYDDTNYCHLAYYPLPNVQCWPKDLDLGFVDDILSNSPSLHSILADLRALDVGSHPDFDEDDVALLILHLPKLRALCISAPFGDYHLVWPRPPGMATPLLDATSQLADLTDLGIGLQSSSLGEGLELIMPWLPEKSRLPQIDTFRVYASRDTTLADAWNVIVQLSRPSARSTSTFANCNGDADPIYLPKLERLSYTCPRAADFY